MIKSNLLIQSGTNLVFPDEPLSIIPLNLDGILTSQNVIHLLGNKEYTESNIETDHKVLFFLSGEGRFVSEQFHDHVGKGDQIVLKKGDSFAVTNIRDEPLLFTVVGVNTRKENNE
ncbi:MAG: hypothetical protein IPM25_19800 [Chloracidobacterium sp.]|nr:hypothetical protein [Chloracidobacterium sp.]